MAAMTDICAHKTCLKVLLAANKLVTHLSNNYHLNILQLLQLL